MNKVFEKIIEKLEIERTIANNTFMNYEMNVDLGRVFGLERAIKIVKEVAEEYNGGWIPCSERLPDNDKKEYIVQKTNGFIYILGFTKDAYKLSRYDFAEYKGKKKQLFYDYDSEYGYTEWECEAWQPLPEPFKERD